MSVILRFGPGTSPAERPTNVSNFVGQRQSTQSDPADLGGVPYSAAPEQ